MSKTIILISGKARSGKDTFAGFLPGYCKYAFADKLKDIAAELGWDEIKDAKGRKLLQDLGTIAREYDPNIWCDILIDTLHYDGCPHRIAITDCRYPNEMEAMKQWADDFNYNWITVRLERPETNTDITEESKQHHSETALDDYEFDHVIYNTFPYTELKYIARAIALLADTQEESV